MIPDTAGGVERSTADDVNSRNEAGLEDSIQWHEAHPGAIDHHLIELDQD